MGCHTWFYEKVEISEEDVLNTVVNKFKEEIEFSKKITLQDKSISDMLEVYLEWDSDYGKNCVEIFNRQLRMIEKGLCKEAVKNKYCSFSATLMKYIPHKGFYEVVNDFHDIFRRGDYPNDILFSLDETLKYIRDNKNKCTIYNNTEEKLQNFWNKYPNGMINFG